MKQDFPVVAFQSLTTPFYYYDTGVLNDTLQTLTKEAGKYNYQIHYAVKANANPRILSLIQKHGLGADCVSGGEIRAALDAGFPAEKIVFAGVGKADWEINLGLDHDIFCFNVESIQELEVINELANKKGKHAQAALRMNPEIDANTHHHITTGTKEDKFGINRDQLEKVLNKLCEMEAIRLMGIHFHIGSQISDSEPFQKLCKRTVEIQKQITNRGLKITHINFGGGLGIDYENPDQHVIPDFKSYFELFHTFFPAEPYQHIHFEPGRSIVGQCGSLISKVLYVKEGSFKKFVVLDAGFTELIRPAMYGAYHRIENLSSEAPEEIYDVVGPICESSDSFAKAIRLNKTERGDLITLRSAGAYGEIMASQYNCRKLPDAHFSDLL